MKTEFYVIIQEKLYVSFCLFGDDKGSEKGGPNSETKAFWRLGATLIIAVALSFPLKNLCP